jgi:hypothetical protein
VLYDSGVEYDDFQDAVIELADGGTRLTKGNVALRLKIEPATASAMLDRMARDGRLELDLDERSGEIFYEVRAKDGGRAKPAGKGALGELGKALDDGALAVKVGTALAMARGSSGMAAGVASRLGGGMALPPEERRQIALGVLLGALVPGLGLAYTAPWPVVVASSLVVVVGYKVLALIPFFSSLLLIPFLVVCAVASALLGGLYTWQYNRTGKRAPLGDEPLSPKQLLKRFKK